MDTPAWLKIAFAEAGVRGHTDGSSNPRVEAYHRSVGSGWRDSVPWCSSFLNWCMQRAGVEGTHSALARSWLAWGVQLEVPRYGCVVVLWRDQPDCERGHVGLFLRQDDEYVFLFGGNQLGEVREHFYPRRMVLGYRWAVGPGVYRSGPSVPEKIPVLGK
ncbi:MAG: TIGR02594 family protein [Nibricoccus sp.]